VYLGPKSFFINSVLFLKLFREHFFPRKQLGKWLPILDDRASHDSAFELLELADSHYNILFCLPIHTTQALQPLTRLSFTHIKI
jgi:hypothetical protein